MSVLARGRVVRVILAYQILMLVVNEARGLLTIEQALTQVGSSEAAAIERGRRSHTRPVY